MLLYTIDRCVPSFCQCARQYYNGMACGIRPTINLISTIIQVVLNLANISITCVITGFAREGRLNYIH